MYPIVEVAANAPEADEDLGTKDKFWFEGERKLFKAARRNTGEDWSEKTASEIAKLFGLPHAHYDLAQWNDENGPVRGVVTPNICPEGASLIHGNELLRDIDPDYGSGQSKFHNPTYTLNRVLESIHNSGAGLPPDWAKPPVIGDACDLFLGYLLLDALIGNTDRHHQNWGLIRMNDATLCLAPTFDHASSLGRELLDEEKSARLQTRDRGYSVRAYTEKAKSAFYLNETDKAHLSSMDAFLHAGRPRRGAALHWITTLESLGQDQIAILIDEVPPERMSPVSADFTRLFLKINRDRLIESKNQL
jgi:hypothetical protein